MHTLNIAWLSIELFNSRTVLIRTKHFVISLLHHRIFTLHSSFIEYPPSFKASKIIPGSVPFSQRILSLLSSTETSYPTTAAIPSNNPEILVTHAAQPTLVPISNTT